MFGGFDIVKEFDHDRKEFPSANEKRKDKIRERWATWSSGRHTDTTEHLRRKRSKQVFAFLLDIIENSPSPLIKIKATQGLPVFGGNLAIEPLLQIVKNSDDLELACQAIRSLIMRYDQQTREDNYWKILSNIRNRTPEAKEKFHAQLRDLPISSPPVDGLSRVCDRCHRGNLRFVRQDSDILPPPPGTNWMPLPRRFRVYQCDPLRLGIARNNLTL